MKNSSNFLKVGMFLLVVTILLGGNYYLMHLSKTQIYNSNTEYDWYFNPTKDNTQPEPIKEADFFKDYDTYYVGDKNQKVIYLTFDAGYEHGTTPQILDALKKHNVVGHFFVVESYIRTNPNLIKRMVDEGHMVCNHSKNHISMASITDDEKFKEEIISVEEAFKEVTGEDMPKFFRPPMGKFSRDSLRRTQNLGYKTIFWSFAYVDWYNNDQPTEEFAKEKIYSRTHPGAIVLLHPNSTTNAKILDDVITHWKEEGYVLRSFNHLLDPTPIDKDDILISE